MQFERPMLCLAPLFFFVCAVNATGQSCPGRNLSAIRLATGAKGGGYRRLGEFVQKVIATEGFRKAGIQEIDLPESSGSDDNIGLIERCEAELAFVQSDIFHEALRGHGNGKFRKPAVQLGDKAFPIYGEYV